MTCACIGDITPNSHRNRHAALPAHLHILPNCAQPFFQLASNDRKHLEGLQNMNISWCVLDIIEPDRKHICYYPGRNDCVAFTMIIKRLLKWWDIFQNTQRSVNVTWFCFFCSPLTHHYKLSGELWFSRSQDSFLTKLTSSESKMSLMTQQPLIPSPAALDIKMELVKSFLIGSSHFGTPLQRRWRRVNFQGLCPKMK